MFNLPAHCKPPQPRALSSHRPGLVRSGPYAYIGLWTFPILWLVNNVLTWKKNECRNRWRWDMFVPHAFS